MRVGLRLVSAAVIVTISACAHGRGSPGELRPDAAPVVVNVVNNYATSMEIYAVGGGTSYHIGSVAPGITRSFELRLAMIASGGHVAFLAQATGAGPRVQSDQLVLSPGDIVDFEITTNLVGSQATVQP